MRSGPTEGGTSEAAGIETCAAFTESLLFRVLSVARSGVRVECKRSRGSRARASLLRNLLLVELRDALPLVVRLDHVFHRLDSLHQPRRQLFPIGCVRGSRAIR